METRSADLRQDVVRRPEKTLQPGPKRRGRAEAVEAARASPPVRSRRASLPPTCASSKQYTIAYIAHAPLEPRAAVAQWENGKLTVWTGTQRPFGVRGELAGAFRLADDAVRVIVPDTGAGYGGKHTGEAAVEAARIARAAGRPVKLVWTREEEFTWAYFRPGRRHRNQERRPPRRLAHRLGVSQLQFRQLGDSIPLPGAQSTGRIPPVAIPLAPGLLSRARLDGESLRPRVAHGRAGARPEARPARIPPEKPQATPGCAPSSRPPPKRSAGAARARPTMGSASRRDREGELRRHLRRGRGRPLQRPRSGRARRHVPSSAAPSSTRTISKTRSKGRW